MVIKKQWYLENSIRPQTPHSCRSHTSSMSRSAFSEACSHRPRSSNSSPMPPPSSLRLRASLAAATVPFFCVSRGLSSRSSFSSSRARLGKVACRVAICALSAANSASRSLRILSVSGSGRESSGLSDVGVCSCRNFSMVASSPLISTGSDSSCCVRSCKPSYRKESSLPFASSWLSISTTSSLRSLRLALSARISCSFSSFSGASTRRGGFSVMLRRNFSLVTCST
jgi:hypothetical protein